MYVAVRRYEGVRDPQKVAKVARKALCPSSAKCRDL